MENYYSFFFSESDKKTKFIMDIPGNSPLTAIESLAKLHPDLAIADIIIIIK